jgi:hypothetical protein
MLNRDDRQFLSYLALGYLAFAEVLSWETSKWPACLVVSKYQDANNRPGYQTCATLFEGVMRGLEFLWDNVTPSNVSAAATVVIALFTVTLWLSTYRLWKAGETHSERELRAYIVAAVQADIVGFHSSKPKIVLSFMNAGQTPAHNVRLWTSSAVAVFPLEKPPDPPSVGVTAADSLGVIGPQGTFHIENSPDAPITVGEREAVIEGRCALFVYGELFYVDAFGKERHTRFCHLYTGEPARQTNGVLGSYHKWNEAT